MGEKFDPSGVRTRDRLVRRQPLYNRYSDANHYTIGSLVISSLDLLVTQVKLYLETTGRQVSSVNVHFDRLTDTHYQMKHILTVWQTCTLGLELTRNILY